MTKHYTRIDMSTEMKRLRVILKGTFGAGYRPYVRKHALTMGLKGFVAPTPTGEMEIIAEGPESTLQKFLEEVVKKPPEGVKIEDIQYEFSEATGKYKTFRPDRLEERD